MSFEYKESDELSFKADNGDFITFLGSSNIINNLTFKKDNKFITLDKDKILKNTSYALNRYKNTFVAETVMDELAFPLESEAKSKKVIMDEISDAALKFRLNEVLEASPYLLSESYKVKLSLARALIRKPKLLIIDNMLDILDMDDKETINKVLKDYVSEGGIIFNFTNNIDETLMGNKVIILDNNKVLVEGETLSVLNEEKIMKRLGYSMPFIILLNKYLKDYELINKYYLSYERLADKLWK